MYEDTALCLLSASFKDKVAKNTNKHTNTNKQAKSGYLNATTQGIVRLPSSSANTSMVFFSSLYSAISPVCVPKSSPIMHESVMFLN